MSTIKKVTCDCGESVSEDWIREKGCCPNCQEDLKMPAIKKVKHTEEELENPKEKSIQQVISLMIENKISIEDILYGLRDRVMSSDCEKE